MCLPGFYYNPGASTCSQPRRRALFLPVLFQRCLWERLKVAQRVLIALPRAKATYIPVVATSYSPVSSTFFNLDRTRSTVHLMFSDSSDDCTINATKRMSSGGGRAFTMKSMYVLMMYVSTYMFTSSRLHIHDT
mmetsp:Transcript_23563/g.62045  ORF Transcript_23563/g.62045 Transcript_23563/m.62045 type:complete len:134 (-) Transcript_23563:880-1281(-)